MILYRLKKLRVGEESDGFEFFATHREARVRQKEVRDDLCNADGDTDDYGNEYPNLTDTANNVTIERIEFSATKQGILALLNKYSDHPDNG